MSIFIKMCKVKKVRILHSLPLKCSNYITMMKGCVKVNSHLKVLNLPVNMPSSFLVIFLFISVY